jgi:hypothetical protein
VDTSKWQRIRRARYIGREVRKKEEVAAEEQHRRLRVDGCPERGLVPW